MLFTTARSSTEWCGRAAADESSRAFESLSLGTFDVDSFSDQRVVGVTFTYDDLVSNQWFLYAYANQEMKPLRRLRLAPSGSYDASLTCSHATIQDVSSWIESSIVLDDLVVEPGSILFFVRNKRGSEPLSPDDARDASECLHDADAQRTIVSACHSASDSDGEVACAPIELVVSPNKDAKQSAIRLLEQSLAHDEATGRRSIGTEDQSGANSGWVARGIRWAAAVQRDPKRALNVIIVVAVIVFVLVIGWNLLSVRWSLSALRRDMGELLSLNSAVRKQEVVKCVTDTLTDTYHP